MFGAPPVGFCGSGILDAIAQLYLAGVIEANGRMNVDHPRVRVTDGEREFVMVSGEKSGGPVLTVTQGDVREIQLAKGAIRTGIQVLLETNGLSEEDIEEVIIAGAFGSYIDIVSAITIGMLPLLPLERFRQVGNAAGTGARMALISRSKRSEAHNIAGRVSYIELAATPHFTHTFAQANYIGLYRMANGKRKEIEEWRQKLQALHGK
ncbi:MAG: ATP-binding protein [Dehalococcoidia bacterium]|nr:ATP-binding protein [Dehalococcoidia bacterium]